MAAKIIPLRDEDNAPLLNSMLVAALDYAGRGLPVFPCRSEGEQAKKPLVAGGFKAATTDPVLIRQWWRRWPRAMIGMPTGTVSGIDVLDLDFKPEESIDGFKFVPNWSKLSLVIARTPSGGAHVWFKSEGKVRCSTDRIGPGVDSRGDRGYVIVPPSYNRALGRAYTFGKGRLDDIARLPTFPSELFARLGAKHDGHPNDDPEAAPGFIRAAMQVIPNPDLGWDDWKKFGLAIWRATGGSQEGFAIWDEWSRKSNKYEADNTRREWESITRSPPTRIGAGSIFFHANEVAPGWFKGSINGRIVLQTNTPVESARAFVTQVFRRDGAPCLVYYRGGFYHWTGTHYAECDGDHLRSKVYQFLDQAVTPKGKPFNPTAHKVNQLIDALQSLGEENAKCDAPFWLGPGPHPANANALIACRNGLLNLETRNLLPHSPHFFNLTCLPFDFDRAAPSYPPQWMAFLRQLWPDKTARRTLQEIFGLMLTLDTRWQKIFMIVGPKRSGKGTIARVLTALVGKDHVCGPTLSGLTSNFGLSPLIDKSVAIIADARLGTRAGMHTVAERLLAISGEDALTIDRKYREPWTGRLQVRFMILANELPKISDASGALTSRFVVLTLTQSFYGREDLQLTDKLLTEASSILNWALHGLDRVRTRGHFKMPESSLQAIRQLEDLASPVGAFVRDWCVVDRTASVPVRGLYDAWTYWCEQHGHKPGPDHTFGRNLHAVLAQVHAVGKGSARSYAGIGLSKEGEVEYELAKMTSLKRRSGTAT